MGEKALGLISQIVGTVPSLFQIGYGRSLMKEASELERQTVRPEAEMAPSTSSLTNYLYGKTMAQDIPGGEIARNEIKGATAAGIRAASEMWSGAEAYGALRGMVGNEQNMFAKLTQQTLNQNMDYDRMYADAMRAKADEENKMWQWNKMQPYLQSVDTVNWLRSAGMQNQFGGLQGLAGSTSQFMDYMSASDTWQKKRDTGVIDVDKDLAGLPIK